MLEDDGRRRWSDIDEVVIVVGWSVRKRKVGKGGCRSNPSYFGACLVNGHGILPGVKT